jgi:RHS repeat-associated protein
LSKAVFPSPTQDGKKAKLNQTITTCYLYEQQRLAAELDCRGNITAQYIYMNARGAPLAMTDANKQVVWQSEDNLSDQAWGRLKAIHAPTQKASGTQKLLHKISFGTLGNTDQASATLNLRLPGQYHDDETGLHYNYQRYYDAREQVNGQPNRNHGRYLTPDPLGYPDGADPYLYVNHDPINKTDALGLYEEDVHYYMTYFLAIMAGLSPEKAQIIALGAQYIDDNPYTRPVAPGGIGGAIVGYVTTNPLAAIDRLKAYHFTQSGNDPIRKQHWYEPTPEQRAAVINAGNLPLPPRTLVYDETEAEYMARRIKDPSNPQLTRLLGAANMFSISDSSGCTPHETLFGEFLHAYEDTFGHRNQLNEPIDVNLGLGHTAYIIETDKTYNAINVLPGNLFPNTAIGNWNMREERTLEMERGVLKQIMDNFKTNSIVTTAELEAVLRAFNATPETSKGTGGRFPDKLKVLNDFLASKKLPIITAYSQRTGCEVRARTAFMVKGKNPPGVIIGTPDCATVPQ